MVFVYEDMNKLCSDAQIRKAIELYENSGLSSAEIADRFDVSPATLTAWVKEAGKPLRGRGRKRFDEPTVRQRAIIAAASIHGCDRTGAYFGIRKQAVHNVLTRWRQWDGTTAKKVAIGDIVKLFDRNVIVLSVEPDGGGFGLDENTNERLRVPSWVVKGRYPRKVGENKHYKFEIFKTKTKPDDHPPVRRRRRLAA